MEAVGSTALSAGDGAVEVPTPCVRECRLDKSKGWCSGCLRTLDEIGRWGSMGIAEKAAVWVRLKDRRTEV